MLESFTHENGLVSSWGANGLSISPEPHSSIKFTPGSYVPVAAPTPAPPANDDIGSAVLLDALTAFPNNIAWNYATNTSNLYTTRYATHSPEVAVCAGPSDAKDVWFYFNANDPNITVRIYGSGGFIPRVEILDFTLNPLSPAVCTVGTQGLIANAVITGANVGDDYYVRVSHDNTGVQAQATATVTSGAVTGLTITTTGTNYSIPKTAYDFYAPQNQGPRFSFSGGGGSGAAAAWVTPTNLTIVSNLTASNISFVGGSGYTSAPTVTIESPDWGITGEFGIIVFAKAANDECADAITLTNANNTTCVTGQNSRTNVVTSAASASPEAVCTGTADDDVWFKFTAADTATLIVVNGNGNFDAVFELWDGGVSPGNCGTKTFTGTCVDNTLAGETETVIANTIVGHTYFVRVFDFNAGSGGSGASFDICVKTAVGDAAVTNIYSLGKLPLVYASPHVVQARVINSGVIPMINVPVTLDITGANTFNNVQVIDTLDINADTTISFAGFSPSNLGLNVMTVSVPGDDDATNNTQTWDQLSTPQYYSYKNASLPNDGGVGFNGATGDFVAKFTSSTANTINEVKVDFTTTGVQYQIAIWDTAGSVNGAPGTLIYTSPTLTTAIGTAFISIPNVPVSGPFFVGVKQLGTVNVGFAYQTEDPIRQTAFFYTSPTGGTAWNDFFSTLSAFRFAIEVGLNIPVPPNCALNEAPANGANVCISAGNLTLNWANGGGAPTGYDVYFDAGSGPATTLVSSNQPGTSYIVSSVLNGTYTWRVAPRNASGAALGCSNNTITVTNSPVVTVTPADTTVCSTAGAVITLTASGATSYSWSPASGLDLTTGPVVHATISGTVAYTVTGTTAGCSSDAVANIHGTPAVNVDATATPSAICNNGSSQLLATANIAGLNYSLTSLTGQTYTTLTGGGVTIINTDAQLTPGFSTGNQDDGGVMVTLPFTFTYAGATYTQIAFSTNGWISPGTSNSTIGAGPDRTATNLFFNTAPNTTIAPWFRDMGANFPAGTGSMRHGSIGTDIYAFQWDKAVGSGFSDGSSILTSFQVNIYGPASSSPGRIEYIYGPAVGTISTGASIGIEDATGGPNHYINGIDGSGTSTTTSIAWPGDGNGFRFQPSAPPAFSYLWTPSTFLNDPTISNPLASNVTGATNTYTVTVTYPGGCTGVDSVTITIDPLSPVVITPQNTTICEGQSQTLTANVSGGGAPLAYLWSDGSTTSSISVSPTTTSVYTVTVTDNCGVSVSSSDSVYVNPAPIVNVTPPTGISCSSSPSTITLTASGNSDSYSWSPSTGLNVTSGPVVQATAITTTTYTVTGTIAATGCTATATSIITAGAPVTATASASDTSICAGASVQLGVEAQLLASGNYTVSNITYSAPTPNSPITLSGWVDNTPSANADDGSVGPIALPFNFTYYGTAYNQIYVGTNGYISFSSLASYTTAELRAVQTFPSSVVPNNLVALGLDDLDLTSIGSVRYWSSGSDFVVEFNTVPEFLSTTATISGYIVLHSVSNAIDILVSNSSITGSHTLGIENSTGTLGTSPAGRNNTIWSVSTPEAYRFTPPVVVFSPTYSWTPPADLDDPSSASPIASNIPAGDNTYTVIVTDPAGGCTASASVVVHAITPPQPQVTPSNDSILCNGQELYVHVADLGFYSGGYPAGTTVDWLGIQSGLTPNDSVSSVNGPYFVAEVTVNINGGSCTATSDTVTIETRSINVTPLITPAQCGNPTGSIVATVTSGFGPYRYIWTDGINTLRDVTSANTSDSIVNLLAGTYYLTVIDNFGLVNPSQPSCNSGQIPYTVLNSNGPAAFIASYMNVTCNAANGGIPNGAATASATGGQLPYAYLWSTTEVTPGISNLSPGLYIVTVTDANGCSDTAQVTITEPDPILINVNLTHVSVCGDSTGAATASASGGTPGYVYEYFDATLTSLGAASTNPTITGLAAGIYYVQVADANSCVANIQFEITAPCSVTLNVKVYMEGYASSFGAPTLPMSAALYWQGMSASDAESDTIRVELRDQMSSATVIETAYAVIDTGGNATVNFTNAVNGGTYWIAVMHRSSIETYSGLPITMGSANTYDFTTGSSMAYGNNMKDVFGDASVWAMFSGDIFDSNIFDIGQDGFIDVFDYLLLDADIQAGQSGYYVTDLNGDGFVDVFDYLMLDPNIQAGVSKITPP